VCDRLCGGFDRIVYNRDPAVFARLKKISISVRGKFVAATEL